MTLSQEMIDYHRAHEKLYPGAPKRTPEELAEFGMLDRDTWREMYREKAGA